MHLLRLLIATPLLFLLTTLARAGTPGVSAPDRILWIGNSFTFYNGGIPAAVEHLATQLLPPSRHGPRKFAMAAEGGAHLHHHTRRILRLLGREAQSWDVIVIQGYSDEPVNPAKRPAFRESLRHLVRMVAETGALPALFMTWAYRDQPEMTTALAEAYAQAGDKTGALVVPVGLAFARAAAHPTLSLYAEGDFKHPSPAGTYLAACVFFSALYGQPALAAGSQGRVPPELAAYLQAVAWETVTAYYGWE